MVGTDKLATYTNMLFVMVDVIESQLLDLQRMYAANGYELRHDTKRNFNTAIAAIKRLKHDVNKIGMDAQESFADDADMMSAIITIWVDRTGDDDKLSYQLFEYVKSFPSKLNLDTSKLDEAFYQAFENKKN